ncbi:hypothetical protein EV560_106154 [Bosea sp. BK604]|nr:hypothetical protein EV560_106154 [Bosea sp. BK604]
MLIKNAVTQPQTSPFGEPAETPLHSRASAALPGVSPSGSIARIAAGLGPRICFAPDPPPAAPPAPPAGDPPAPPAAPPAGDPPAAAQRPDWLGEQFWDAEKGEVKGADLKAAFDDLTAFKAGEESKRAAVPEKADGYELKLPADLKFADGESFELDKDDPMFGFGREVAHKLGLDQAGFEGLVGMYAQQKIAEAKEIQAAQQRHFEAMGPKAAERQNAVKTFLAAKLGADAPVIFDTVLMLKPGVEAMEKLMRVASGGNMPSFTQGGRDGGKASPSEEEYAAMSPAERLVAARKSASGGR